MNILYLLHILKTNKLSELVANIDTPYLDMNLAIWEAERDGLIEVDEDKDRVKALQKHEISFDADLSNKLIRAIQHYASKEINITRGRLNSLVKNATNEFNYPYHDYLMSLQYLIDTGQVVEMIESVPKEGKRPYHKFVFLCLPENPNEDWNRAEVNKWIANWHKKK